MSFALKRGGRREGAGGKAADGVKDVIRKSVALDAKTIETALEYGDNLSAGLRQIARLVRRMEGKKS